MQSYNRGKYLLVGRLCTAFEAKVVVKSCTGLNVLLASEWRFNRHVFSGVANIGDKLHSLICKYALPPPALRCCWVGLCLDLNSGSLTRTPRPPCPGPRPLFPALHGPPLSFLLLFSWTRKTSNLFALLRCFCLPKRGSGSRGGGYIIAK